jgi:FdhD protein
MTMLPRWPKMQRMDEITTNGCTSRHDVARLKTGQWSHAQDVLAEEIPIAMEYNGVSHAVMLATPSDLEAFALGFSLSEGIIASTQDFYEVEAERGETGITLHIRVSNAAFAALKERRRNLVGRTGCGLCGAESLDQALRSLPKLAASAALTASAIRRALGGLNALQPLNRLTGAMHAAAWCDSAGQVLAAYEDVGRHNALDKLIGAMAKSRTDFLTGFTLVTSRASVEMVQKAIAVGMPALVAVSAPTGLAVRTAEQSGLTLVAFARGDEFVGYANTHNIRLD